MLYTAIANFSSSVNELSSGVRVSGGHLYEVEAPTEAAAETSLTYAHSAANFFRNHHTTLIANTRILAIAVAFDAGV